MGHVSSGSFPPAGADSHFQGRQHRGAGTWRHSLTPHQLGALGEKLAGRFLIDRGASIVARNLRVGRGEIDLLVRFGSEPAAVEVKTVLLWPGALDDPADAFTPQKAAQVRKLAGLLGVVRVDLVAVAVLDEGADFRWIPRVA